MNIDTLTHELIKQRQIAKQHLDSGDLDAWLNAMPAEFKAADRLRAELLRHPVVVTNNPAVKQLLAETDLSEIDDLDKVGMELLWGSISPTEYASNLALVDVLIAPFQIP